MAKAFDHAHDFRIETFNQVFHDRSADPLSELRARIVPEAIHDSDERCDAPKCHPETRVAVQNDLYDWAVEENKQLKCPEGMKWVTGPAGSGKSAIMGSLSVRCAEKGVLGATFFFSSWSATTGRRRKIGLVTTIAYQLAEHREDLKIAISNAIEKNPTVFKKNLHVQMEILVLAPLREVAVSADRPRLRGAIIIDGVDECEAEQYRDTTSKMSKVNPTPERTADQDQLEILQVLRLASSDPSFPFRILIASRPESVFRNFFNPENGTPFFAKKVDLHEEYNADADMTLFLDAEFNRIRRHRKLSPSWLPSGAVQILVGNASGQFIYVATVIRLLDSSRLGPPKALLEAILSMEAKPSSNPLKQLDILYSHILSSSPEPLRSVLWIRSIRDVNDSVSSGYSYASNMHLLLQTDPDINEAEHLLGNLHSLIRIPPPSKQATTKYDFYHKSLFDFLKDPDRCGKLHVKQEEVEVFLWDGFIRVCNRDWDTQCSYPESFQRLLACPSAYIHISMAATHSQVLPTPASADWWASLAIACEQKYGLWHLFQVVHKSCPSYHCKRRCKIWSQPILRHSGEDTGFISLLSWRDRESRKQKDRFLKLARKAIEDA